MMRNPSLENRGSNKPLSPKIVQAPRKTTPWKFFAFARKLLSKISLLVDGQRAEFGLLLVSWYLLGVQNVKTYEFH